MERKRTGTRRVADLRKAFLEYKEGLRDDVWPLWNAMKAEHPNHPITKELNELFKRKPSPVRREPRRLFYGNCAICGNFVRNAALCKPCEIVYGVSRGEFSGIPKRLHRHCASLLLEAHANALAHPDWCLMTCPSLRGDWFHEFKSLFALQAARDDENLTRNATRPCTFGHKVKAVALLCGAEKLIRTFPDTEVTARYEGRKLHLSLKPASFIPSWLRDVLIAERDMSVVEELVHKALDGDVNPIYNRILESELSRE